jgi:preprotein translocase subunit YajC
MTVPATGRANLVRLPMEPLIVLAVTFVLLWALFILPQQRRVRAHQALVASVQPGDEVVLSAGIYGRIVDLGPEDMTLAVAPGVELRVARQAVLRRVEDATGAGDERDQRDERDERDHADDADGGGGDDPGPSPEPDH